MSDSPSKTVEKLKPPAGIVIVSAPTQHGTLACLARTLVVLRAAFGDVIPDGIPDNVPPGGIPGLLGSAVTVLPRSPLDEVEANAIVQAASSGALIIVPFVASSADGAQSAVRSLLGGRRRAADDVLLGVAFDDCEERPGAKPGRILHVKGKDAVRLMAASGLFFDYDGSTVAYDIPTNRWHRREATEVLAWRLAAPDAVPAERRDALRSPLVRLEHPENEEYA